MSDPMIGALTEGSKTTTELASKGIDLWFQKKAMDEQRKEDRRVETLGLKLRDEDIARDDKRYEAESRFRERGFKSAEQEKKYNKFMTFTTNFNNQLLQNSQLKNNMVNIWQGRR